MSLWFHQWSLKLDKLSEMNISGTELKTIKFPASRTTSCCFGGENMDELYVTSGKFGASEEEIQREPLAGSVFKVTGLGVKGKAAPVFED